MGLERILNKGKKILAYSLLVGSLASPLSAQNTQAQESNKKNFFFDVSPFRYETALVNEIKNIPLEIRDIPKHPGDWEVPDENIAPIEDKAVGLYDRISIGTKTGINLYPHNDCRIGLGLVLDLDLNAPPLIGNFKWGERKDTVKRNYTTEPGTDKKGYGAALTYYKIYPTFLTNWNSFLRPSFYSEIEIKLAKKLSLALGCDIFKETIVAENGWDRGNSEEKKGKYKLANLVIGKPCASLKFYTNPYQPEQYIGIDVGLFDLRSIKLTDLGKDVDFNFKEMAWFVGLRVGSNF